MDYGMVQNLWPQEVGHRPFGRCQSGQGRGHGAPHRKIMSIPVSEEMLGRIISPLGLPLDGRGSIKLPIIVPSNHRLLGIAARQPVDVPLETGLKAVDALVPIGRGSVNSLSVTAEREKRPLPSILSSIKKVRTSSAFM